MNPLPISWFNQTVLVFLNFIRIPQELFLHTHACSYGFDKIRLSIFSPSLSAQEISKNFLFEIKISVIIFVF